MRRYEIDWIRNISILMLFIYHTSAIFCSFGEFYIISESKNILANLCILVMFVWYMPLLFFLAGASTYYASKKRDLKGYLKERVLKLLIPLLFGILFLVPPQVYLARVWRGEVGLSYLDNLKYFFTHITDLSGYDGSFSPAHLWFILYLFVISVIGGFIIFKIFKAKKYSYIVNVIKSCLLSKYSFIYLLLLSIISDIFPSIMGKSLIGSLIIFILGYVCYSDIGILNKIVVNRFKLLFILFISLSLGLAYIILFREGLPSIFIFILDGVLKNSLLISAIGTILSFSSLYLSKSNVVLDYLNNCAFAIYIVHQPILLALAFIIVPLLKSTTLAMLLIIVFSFTLSIICVESLKSFKLFKFVLGLK